MKKRKNINNDLQSILNQNEYPHRWYSVIWFILRPLLMFITSVLLALGIINIAIGNIGETFINPVDVHDNTEISFEVKSGTSLSSVSKQLENTNLIRNGTVFKYYSDFLGLGQKIQTGSYKLKKSMTISQIADILASGDGLPLTTNITIIPGWNIEDIADMLVTQKIIINTDEFISLCNNIDKYKDYYFIAEIIQNTDIKLRKYALEGYLCPNTYEIYTDTNADEIVNKLLKQTEASFNNEFFDRADELNMTPDEILTLASIIEKESKLQDFNKVSAVFHNRLKKDMLLQSDVTVQYVINERRMALRDSDLAVDSPYNTYKYKGLTPGPICNPSIDAIYAALYPDEEFLSDKYYYFCSKDPNTGELHFSKTLEEHEQAVAIYAPLWKKFDESRGLTDGI